MCRKRETCLSPDGERNKERFYGTAAPGGGPGGAHPLLADPKAGEKSESAPGQRRRDPGVHPLELPPGAGGPAGAGQVALAAAGAGAAAGPAAGAAAGAVTARLSGPAAPVAGPGLSSDAAPGGGLSPAEAPGHAQPVGQLPLDAGLYHPEHRPGPLPAPTAGLCGPAAGSRVLLEINATYDSDGSTSTTDDRSEVTYSVELTGKAAGEILRNGYYRVAANITGLVGQDCAVSVTVADWETPVTQNVELGA